jgi:hypothetical protein
VGDVDVAARALVGVHPVADFQQGELEEADVDGMPLVGSALSSAVASSADAERSPIVREERLADGAT